MPLQIKGRVIKNGRIKPLYFILGIDCPPIADQIRPGQFVMLKVSGNTFPLLRRPFSVYKSYPTTHPEKKKRGHLIILYKEVGKGTREMAALSKGQEVDLIGPLGNGFTLPPLPFSANTILVGGGVGIASLHSLAVALKGRKVFVFIGGRTINDVLGADDFKKLDYTIFTATEDGSLGFHGTVVDLLTSQKKLFEGSEGSHIYACGPISMLKALAKGLNPEEVMCQVSLEARMGCGFGACWGCVVKTKHSKMRFQRVCQEGPVFRLEDLDWK